MGRTRTSIVCRAIIGFSFALAYPAIADTIVGGIISTDTVWSVDGSPYVAEQSVLVMGGATLRILPGVVVRFDPDKALSINEGTLVAMGTAASNILFTANASPPDVETNRWGYIGFWDNAVAASFDEKNTYTNGCILENAVIEYAGGTVVTGGIHVEKSSPFIHLCLIRHNINSGISLKLSQDVNISGSTVYSNSAYFGESGYYGGGITLIDSRGTVLANNRIAGNTSVLGGGITVWNSAHTLLMGNTICDNEGTSSGGGVVIFRSDFSLLNDNVIRACPIWVPSGTGATRI
jgi:hypothetical protein